MTYTVKHCPTILSYNDKQYGNCYRVIVLCQSPKTMPILAIKI